MTKIDWNKPIETVPCQRNPLPVPCEFAGFDDDDDDGDAKVFIRGDWFSNEDDNYRDSDDEIFPWLADALGEIEMGGSSIYLRNVAEAEDADDAAEKRIRDAAPELLQALEKAEAIINRMDMASWLAVKNPAEFSNALVLVEEIRAAIAKAKGE